MVWSDSYFNTTGSEASGDTVYGTVREIEFSRATMAVGSNLIESGVVKIEHVISLHVSTTAVTKLIDDSHVHTSSGLTGHACRQAASTSHFPAASSELLCRRRAHCGGVSPIFAGNEAT